MNFDGFFFGSLHFGYVQRYRNNEGKKKNEDVARYERVKLFDQKETKQKIAGKFQSKSLSQWPILFLILVFLCCFDTVEQCCSGDYGKRICQNSHFIGTWSKCIY